MNKANVIMTQSIETKIEVAITKLEGLDQRFNKLEEKIDNQYVLKVEYITLEGRVSKLEADQRWIVRTFIAAAVSSIVGFFYAFQK